ncbi:hypothetical protein FGB62_359g07 [Gracilaria domingensis]|nr:hypothetical protein FGB62_521g00 [Gracilaria domingensis]KAI0557005.1 hypothetical protein FGB62_359g07 [Gracilaria domingensis]
MHTGLARSAGERAQPSPSPLQSASAVHGIDVTKIGISCPRLQAACASCWFWLLPFFPLACVVSHAVVSSKGVTQAHGGSAAFHTYPLRYRNPAAPHANAPAARRVNTGRHAEKDNAKRSYEGHLRWLKRAVQRERKQSRERHQHAVFKKSLTTHRRRSAKFGAPFAAHNGRNLAKNCRRCYSR